MFQPLMGSCNADVLDTKQKINGLLYKALVTCNKKDVVDLCQRISDHALHVITVNDDTVLHMATYAKEAALVERLLDELPDYHVDKLTRQNRVGNTILHETATSNHAIAVADKLLKRAPGLLGMRNHNGETALFRAARNGKTDMFNFLAAKVSGYDEAGLQFYVQRSDKTTILHIAILSEHFDLAYRIALDYRHLISEKDGDGMTSLQLLSCNPSAFKQDPEDGFIKLAVELAKLLSRNDTSWEVTYSSIDQSKPKIHRYGEIGGQEGMSLAARIPERMDDVGETPLILATKSGIVEIVEEILRLYPQAVEHVDDEGRNVLHVAIKYRELKIFELVTKMEVPMKRLVRKIDNEGNSILHTVGIKRKDFVSEKMEGPAFLLQEELLWFELEYRQAVEHIDDEGRNVLHVAIKYRQKKIFELVKGMDVPMKRLTRKIDGDGNSILHTVGKKRKDFISDEKMEGPAFLLQEELLWFEEHFLDFYLPAMHIYHTHNSREAQYFFIVILILNPEAVGVDVLQQYATTMDDYEYGVYKNDVMSSRRDRTFCLKLGWFNLQNDEP
ncbi:hypothetical protein POTOM_039201 [Populus tomentosa]|uniref:Ankyrin repeat family protein n=1 Tax=Populus tomentosa TaxID=118781 RepID=A0A8X8CBD7_POPTO|nr:hypothetical protein POTOM_039201 [Populus tomentosa]